MTKKIEGQRPQLHHKFKALWGKLTDDDLVIAGRNIDHMAGKLSERYGIGNIEANLQIAEFNLAVYEIDGLDE